MHFPFFNGLGPSVAVLDSLLSRNGKSTIMYLLPNMAVSCRPRVIMEGERIAKSLAIYWTKYRQEIRGRVQKQPVAGSTAIDGHNQGHVKDEHLKKVDV